MPTIDNLLKNETAKGVAIGLGAALVGVAAIPTVIMVAGHLLVSQSSRDSYF